MKALVTGSAGFIGRRLVKRLMELGHEVYLFDQKATLPQDICRYGDLIDSVGACKYDAIYHLAATASIDKCEKNPHKTNNVNINGTLNALSFAVSHGATNFIFASSAAVYGPPTPYSIQKIASEQYIEYFARAGQIKGISLRLFNVYGSGQNPEHNAVIPSFIEKIKAGKPVVINGDGTQERDFVHVDDVVEAFIKAADYNGNYFCCDIGTGIGTSINDLVDAVGHVIGKRPSVEYRRDADFGIKRSVADTQCIDIKKLGFQAEIGLLDGLGRIVNGE